VSKLDITRPLCTRLGHHAELLALLPEERAAARGERLVVLVTNADGERSVETYLIDGTFDVFARKRSLMDLVNEPFSMQVHRILEAARR
jgi:hypothetical protein